MTHQDQSNDAFLKDLAGVVGIRHVLTNTNDMIGYLEDWRGYATGRAVAVVLPGSTVEVADVMKIAARYGRAVVPQGGNTGLCQGAIPTDEGQGIVLALGRMTTIREIDKPSGVLVIEAGATLTAAHEAAESVDRRVPLHLGSEGSAQIGGLVSTNAGGTGALRYGPIRELVCGLEVVLPDGRILEDLKALRKNNTGYDLKNLFIGAEGTLGIVTAAALRMQPLLHASAHAWIALRDIGAAVELLMRLQDRFDTSVQAAELLSGNEVDLVLRHIPRSRQPFDDRPDWSLLIELGSTDASADLRPALEDWLAERFEEGTVTDAFVAQSEAQASDIWHVRHSVSEANKIHGHSLSHDVAVRPAMVPEMIKRCSAAVQRLHPDANILIVSHIGDGNVHFIVHFTHEEWAAFANPDEVTGQVMALVHDEVEALGGTFSAEHGIGRKLTGELSQRTDAVRMDLMQALRRLIDPDLRMNPGAVFPL
ncbi:FAD-binding oxidoreductase [Falsochrobactrum shanghaiense]|uniref:FAD-binding oxidoreductase n=1 Tax=Falsochrobactrum shanghaiense TaxID=2201899 RepID=A0A316JWF9_9HYPH|nr:FAD-binding oxidoreductase [Falsochrobactrum shanghaiense]PWL19480.1 FAD-binding oxidoreductase [Falsochrobactrum shanghaiense]